MNTWEKITTFLNRPYIRVPILVLIPFAILGVPLGMFYHKFGGYGLSSNNSDWSNFSTFFNSFVLLCNVYLFVLLTLSIDRYTRKKDQAADNFQRGLVRPVLIFKSKIIEDQSEGRKEIWHIENIGNGAALNLKIGEWKAGKWVGKVVKGYSLGSAQDLVLDWLLMAALLCVTYEDIFKKKYVAIGVGDETYPMAMEDWDDFILEHSQKFTRKDLEQFDERTAIRVYDARKKEGSSTSGETPTTSPTG